VKSLGQDFFASAGFSEEENRRVCRGDSPQKIDHLSEGQRGSHNQAQIAAGFDFFCEILIFSTQAVTQLLDLLVRQYVVDRVCDLGGDLLEEFTIVLIEMPGLNAADVQRAEAMFPDEQGQIDHSSQTFLHVIPILQKDLFFLEILSDMQATVIMDPTDCAALAWNHAIVRQGRSSHVGDDGIKAKGIGL